MRMVVDRNLIAARMTQKQALRHRASSLSCKGHAKNFMATSLVDARSASGFLFSRWRALRSQSPRLAKSNNVVALVACSRLICREAVQESRDLPSPLLTISHQYKYKEPTTMPAPLDKHATTARVHSESCGKLSDAYSNTITH